MNIKNQIKSVFNNHPQTNKKDFYYNQENKNVRKT